MGSSYVILSDSITLIKSIEYAFEGEMEFCNVDSLASLKQLFLGKNIDLLIADIDIKEIDPAKIITCLDEMGNSGSLLLFLASEQTLLDLNKNIDFSLPVNHGSEWLIKPYSKNALFSAITKLGL